MTCSSLFDQVGLGSPERRGPGGRDGPLLQRRRRAQTPWRAMTSQATAISIVGNQIGCGTDLFHRAPPLQVTIRLLANSLAGADDELWRES